MVCYSEAMRMDPLQPKQQIIALVIMLGIIILSLFIGWQIGDTGVSLTKSQSGTVRRVYSVMENHFLGDVFSEKIMHAMVDELNDPHSYYMTPVQYERMLAEESGIRNLEYRFLEGGAAYVRIFQFNEDLVLEFEKVIERIEHDRVQRLVLDLRDNPGGDVLTAVYIVDQFVESGSILTEREKDKKSTLYSATSKTPLADIELAVLINADTASAAEIVAAALQDHGRGTIFGQSSKGKGSVQRVFELQGGRAVQLTTAHWLRPSGEPVNGLGVSPDVYVDGSSDTLLDIVTGNDL